MALPRKPTKRERAIGGIAGTLASILVLATSHDLQRFLLLATQQYGIYGLIVSLAVISLLENWKRAQRAEKRAAEADARAQMLVDARFEEHSRALADWERRYNTLSGEFADYKQKAEARAQAHESQIEAMQKRIETLVDELKEAKARYEAEKRHSIEVEAVNEHLQRVNDRLVQENLRHIEEKGKLERRVAELESQTSTLKREITELKARLQQYEGEHTPTTGD